jgi:branched-subunit amino acid ABC-type transport system permease component
MTLDQIIQSVVGGLAIGCIYSLVALGISMIIRATEIQHFAQGELLMIGAFAGLSTVWLGRLPFVAVMLAGMAGGGIVATLIELVAYRPLRARGVPLINVIIATLAVSLVLQNGARLIWGSEPLRYPSLFSSTGVLVLGVPVAPQMIWIVGLSFAMMVALQLFFRFTRLGLAMQAAAQDSQTAQLMGISVSRVATVTFAIAGVMAGGAGVLLGSLFFASFAMGFGVAIKAFVAATLGGLGSVTGAMVGGLLFGLIETFGGLVISTAYKDALGMIVLIAVLLLAPQGLFGRAERRV